MTRFMGTSPAASTERQEWPLEPSAIEGLTRPTLEAYFSPLSLLGQKKTRFLKDIQMILAAGQGRTISTASARGDDSGWDYLISGHGRYLVRGHGRTCETFHELAERLTFFAKAGFARPKALLAQAISEQPCFITLLRDEQYRYMFDNRPITLTASDEKLVELSNTTCALKIDAPTFWGFVFQTEDSRAELSVNHAAQLLGLSVLTLSRRIGEGKLPAVRRMSSHPGLTQAGLEEYLMYRRLYPQGCISPSQHERWKNWQVEWERQYCPCPRTVTASGAFQNEQLHDHGIPAIPCKPLE